MRNSAVAGPQSTPPEFLKSQSDAERPLMAQKVNIVLVDDIDGSDATQTVSFGLDGTSYEIDLNDAHAGELREALAGYVGHARKVTGGRRRSGGTRSTASTSAHSPAEVREWARSNGYDVPSRGRIPADVRQAFDAAH
jgi:hypothetical protein